MRAVVRTSDDGADMVPIGAVFSNRLAWCGDFLYTFVIHTGCGQVGALQIGQSAYTELMATTPQSNTTTKPPKKRRGLGALFNLILIIGIIAVIGAFVWAEQQRRSAQNELQQTAAQLEELRQSSQRTGQQVAQQVLEKVRAHMDIPSDPEPTVATIVDAAALKEANDFYAPAENGDHLIITQSRAVLYDPDRDIILDVVPVQLNTADNVPEGEEGADGEAVEGEASPSPVGSPAAGAGGDDGATPSPEAAGMPSPNPFE